MQLPYRSELKTLQLSDPQLPGLAFHRFYLLLKIIKVTEKKLGDTVKELDRIIIPTSYHSDFNKISLKSLVFILKHALFQLVYIVLKTAFPLLN